MPAPHEHDLDVVLECLEQADLTGLRQRLDEMRIQDIAHVLMALEPDPRREVFRLLAPGRRVDVFSYLDPH
ncbi:MAG: magnesium transporter MgtE N-terminal domain-containing protein, partial [Ectothiorhodospira sp.]